MSTEIARRYNPKYAVLGYVRSSHLSLFQTSSYSLFQNVPITITSICVKYYEPKEYFDTIYEDEIRLSVDRKTIHKHNQRINGYCIRFNFPFGLENTSFGWFFFQG